MTPRRARYFASCYKERPDPGAFHRLKPVASDAAIALDALALKWGATYPQIATSWRHHWARVIPFFAYAPEIRRVIDTTNAIERVNYS